MQKPFRFGVQCFNTESAKAWTETSRQAEALGYSTLHLADHILGPGDALDKTNHPAQNLAPVPAMAHAAAVTTTLNIGCRVFCIDYRSPIMLAKETMTLDFLSEGRLELGLGAGWLKEEYLAVGFSFDDAPIRIDRLEQVIEGIKAFATQDPVSIKNSTIHWRDFEGLPKPVSKPYPPLMIGGGSPRILKLAGREADIVSLNFNNRSGMISPDGVQTSSAEETAKKVNWIRSGAGDRFDELELEIGAYFTFVVDNAKSIASEFGANFGLSEEEMLRHPHALFGSVDVICEELIRRRETYGISYITEGQDNLQTFAPVVAKLAGT